MYAHLLIGILLVCNIEPCNSSMQTWRCSLVQIYSNARCNQYIGKFFKSISHEELIKVARNPFEFSSVHKKNPDIAG